MSNLKGMRASVGDISRLPMDATWDSPLLTPSCFLSCSSTTTPYILRLPSARVGHRSSLGLTQRNVGLRLSRGPRHQDRDDRIEIRDVSCALSLDALHDDIEDLKQRVDAILVAVARSR
jgi:hypothetical protein